jgi:hypothetical protein
MKSLLRFFIGFSLILVFLAPLNAMEGPKDAKYFPEVTNWTRPIKLNTYDANNLWDKIDGAADSYLSYNFEELTIGDYTAKDGKYISLEVYRHKTPEDAFGIYSQERPQDGKFKNVGAQGYEVEGSFNFVSDRYYVKVRSNYSDAASMNTIREIAKKAAALISGTSMLPEILRLFPQKTKLPNTEQYINSNFLGYSFLGQAFTSTYSLNGSTFNLFIVKYASPASAKETLIKYLAQVKSNLTAEEGKRLLLDDKYNGKVNMEWKGSYLFGSYSTNAAEVPAEYFQTLEEKLK